jgi:hypothetical protein
MSPEIRQTEEGQDPERRRDLAWIEENRAILWLVATVAFEEIGYGCLHIDLSEETAGRGQRVSYYAEGEIEAEPGGTLRRLLDAYDPDREFVAVLQKVRGQRHAYLGLRPSAGWYAEMQSQTSYHKPPGE